MTEESKHKWFTPWRWVAARTMQHLHDGKGGTGISAPLITRRDHDEGFADTMQKRLDLIADAPRLAQREGDLVAANAKLHDLAYAPDGKEYRGWTFQLANERRVLETTNRELMAEVERLKKQMAVNEDGFHTVIDDLRNKRLALEATTKDPEVNRLKETIAAFEGRVEGQEDDIERLEASEKDLLAALDAMLGESSVGFENTRENAVKMARAVIARAKAGVL